MIRGSGIRSIEKPWKAPTSIFFGSWADGLGCNSSQLQSSPLGRLLESIERSMYFLRGMEIGCNTAMRVTQLDLNCRMRCVVGGKMLVSRCPECRFY